MSFFMISIALLLAPPLTLSLEEPQSAASAAQIKTAVENNYDATGPGAKTPDYAYKTYNNIEDALLDYLNDPDTKLPTAERSVAFQKLVDPQKQNYLSYFSQKPAIPFENEDVLPPKLELQGDRFAFPDKNIFTQDPVVKFGIHGINKYKGFQPDKFKSEFGFNKISPLPIKTSPAFTNAAQNHYEQLNKHNPNPAYSFAYGVHDRHTGDVKSAKETREGGQVRGFYTVMDPDGKQRTVHYTADDKQGFRAVVQRTKNNHF